MYYSIFTLIDATKHKKAFGSDTECEQILYYVWPAIIEDETILDGQMMYVLLEESLFTPYAMKLWYIILAPIILMQKVHTLSMFVYICIL